MHRAVILDLDGTVADTLRTIAAALNEGLERLGLPTHDVAAVADMVGEGVAVLCRKGLPAGADDRFDELLVAVRSAYDREPMRHCRLYDGMESTLRELARRGARLAVLSNKPHPLTEQTVRGLGLDDLFEVVLGHREEFPHKPDPKSAWHVAARLGVEPAEVLYVGDTPIDMQTARAAGFTAVGVTWGFRSRDVLAECGPRHLIDEPRELLDLFGPGSPR